MIAEQIPGYSKGSAGLARSPVTLADFDLLKKTVLFDDDDVRYLRMSAEVLKDQTSAVLDVWYGFVGSNPHLLSYFIDERTNQPDKRYLERVRSRFEQWILDTAKADYGQEWLDYQYEIALRHHRSKKNRTDNAHAPAIIHFRYLPALIYPVTATLKPFLDKKGHSPEDVERMHRAWVKSVLLQVILWSYPYVREGDF